MSVFGAIVTGLVLLAAVVWAVFRIKVWSLLRATRLRAARFEAANRACDLGIGGMDCTGIGDED